MSRWRRITRPLHRPALVRLLVGIAVACQRLDLGLIAVICLYGTAVLTNIKAKMIGEFTLATFGPTEFKTLLVLLGLTLVALQEQLLGELEETSLLLLMCLQALIAVGIIQLVLSLIIAVKQVNAKGPSPDTSEWETRQRPN